jgi:hypothetical protein
MVSYIFFYQTYKFTMENGRSRNFWFGDYNILPN